MICRVFFSRYFLGIDCRSTGCAQTHQCWALVSSDSSSTQFSSLPKESVPVLQENLGKSMKIWSSINLQRPNYCQDVQNCNKIMHSSLPRGKAHQAVFFAGQTCLNLQHHFGSHVTTWAGRSNRLERYSQSAGRLAIDQDLRHPCLGMVATYNCNLFKHVFCMFTRVRVLTQRHSVMLKLS